MNPTTEDALWRMKRREKSPSTEWPAVLAAIKDEAHKRGWAVSIVDDSINDDEFSFVIRLIDARDVRFSFQHEARIAELENE